MARTPRLKISESGIAHYHLMSRTNDRRFLFGKGGVKTELVAALRRAAAFSGIEIRAYAVMDNHFHVVCTVTRGDEAIPGEELLRRYGLLKGDGAADELAAHWKELSCAGFASALEEEQDRLRRRMGDISEFVKTFKEMFDRQYKRERAYCGSIWSGRFKSTLIEDGRYLAVCKRYVVLNPVRAGIVTMVKDYSWSWSEDDGRADGREVPDAWLLRRVVQIGCGGIFGSAAFVRRRLFGFGGLLRSSSASPHPVGDVAYSSHGWRLAQAAA